MFAKGELHLSFYLCELLEMSVWVAARSSYRQNLHSLLEEGVTRRATAWVPMRRLPHKKR